MEISEVRQRILRTLQQAKQHAAERRVRRAEADRDYDRFLEAVAVPVFRMGAIVLRAERHPFELVTPPGTVRLVPERSSGGFLEISLDTTQDPPVVVGRARVSRGRETTETERPVRAEKAIAALTEEDVLEFLATALEPFLG